jgi:hypothetical protein
VIGRMPVLIDVQLSRPQAEALLELLNRPGVTNEIHSDGRTLDTVTTALRAIKRGLARGDA